MNEEIIRAIRQVLAELAAAAALNAGDIVAVGCSTSEVLGHRIGTASSMEVATLIVDEILEFCRGRYTPAFQCCEHLNRALVLEKTAAALHGFCPVWVRPTAAAGGALAAQAMARLRTPVVVEHIAAQAKAGLDIGNTLIGMHIQPVVVPLRLKIKTIGKAAIVCARSRPKLIGGRRAVYLDW